MNYSVIVFIITFLIIGFILIYITKYKGINFDSKLLTLFGILYIGYLLFALVVNAAHEEIGVFFLYTDQNGFFAEANLLSKSNSLREIFIECFINKSHQEDEGAYFLFGSIAYIGNTYFNGNSILLQTINVSFVGVLCNIFLYKTLLYYFDRAKAFRYTLYFAFLSPIFYYSPWLLRDIHITLFYMVGIYLVHKKFKLRIFLSFALLFILTYQFRVSHGLFFIVFPFLYLINKGRNHKNYKLILVLLSCLVIFSVYIYSSDLIYIYNSIYLSYDNLSEFTSESLNNSGLGSQLYKLPTGIKELALIVNSQISQFPPWFNVSDAKTIIQMLIGIAMLVNSVFWSYIFVFTIFSMTQKKVRRKITNETLIWLSVIFVFFLINSVNINVRRIFCVYPIIYLVFLEIRRPMSIKEKYRINHIFFILYSLLITFYLILKS